MDIMVNDFLKYNRVDIIGMLHKSLLVIFILPLHFAYSQHSSPDSLSVRRLADSIITLYNKIQGENTLLYNGREYTGNYSRSIGHPFYASDQPQKGSLLYDGIEYQHSAISYDLVNDEVFIKTGQNVSVKLLPEKLDHFSIEQHLFVRLAAPDENNSMNIGFYEVLREGTIAVLAKRRKQLIPSFNLEDPYKFVHYDRFFISIKDSYHEIENERSLLSLFPGEKKELRKFLRNNELSFKKNAEHAIVAVAEYYDELKRK